MINSYDFLLLGVQELFSYSVEEFYYLNSGES